MTDFRYRLALLAMLLAGPLPTPAATLWVTRADDTPVSACPSDDRCTLRRAVDTAASGDEIRFSPLLGETVAIGLDSPLTFDRLIELTVQGPGSDRLALRPTGLFRTLVIAAGTITLADLTVRDGTVIGQHGATGATAGASGAVGGGASGGCIFVISPLPVTLLRVAVRDCTVLGGDGGHGATGERVDRGIGGAGGNGGSGGEAAGAGIAVVGSAQLRLLQTSVSGSLAAGGRGGNGGRGGDGSLAGGAGGNGGRGGRALGAGIHLTSNVQDTSDIFHAEDVSFLENGLVGGDGGARGGGGRSTGIGAVGAAGTDGIAGEMSGGQLFKTSPTRMTLVHTTLGPPTLERGTPGNWDGVTDAGRSSVTGEVLHASHWRVQATVLVGASPYSLCSGVPPTFWGGSGQNAASSPDCLQDGSMPAHVGDFANAMQARFEQGRAVVLPSRFSLLVDSTLCVTPVDQSGRTRPLDGDGDGVAACDRGAAEIEFATSIFADGFDG